MQTRFPPPRVIPQKLLGDPALKGFFSALVSSLYQTWFASGGKDGLTNFIVADSPASDPGWAGSSSTDMTPPDGYIKARMGDQEIVIPYWHT